MFDYTRMPNRSILMLDAKSFYASAHCALLGLDPMRTCLVVVGDLERSGSIVLAASPLMKKEYGIKTGNRLFEVPKHDARIHIVKAQMSKYLDMSLELTRILEKFAPFDSILQYSVDEAWIDVTGTEKLWGDKWQVARSIQETIWNELKIPVAIGIGPNMLVAKLCLDMDAKKQPEGLAEWQYADLRKKLWPHSLKEMWGIGSRMEKNLQRLGIRTIGQLAQYEVSLLEKRFGIMGVQLYHHAWGIDFSRVRPNYNQAHKSYGNGITLLRGYTEKEEIKVVIRELCDEVTTRARKDRMAGRTISLGIGYSKDGDREGFSRSMSMEMPTNLEDEVCAICYRLFEQYYISGAEVRNVYVCLSNLHSDEQVQLDMFSFKTKEKKRSLALAVDQIRDRFGSASILKASSLTAGGVALERSMKIGGHYG